MNYIIFKYNPSKHSKTCDDCVKAYRNLIYKITKNEYILHNDVCMNNAIKHRFNIFIKSHDIIKQKQVLYSCLISYECNFNIYKLIL